MIDDDDGGCAAADAVGGVFGCLSLFNWVSNILNVSVVLYFPRFASVSVPGDKTR
jgi:hypothetical protein